MKSTKHVLIAAFAAALLCLCTFAAVEMPALADAMGANGTKAQLTFTPTPGLTVNSARYDFGTIQYNQFGGQTWTFEVKNEREEPKSPVQVYPLVGENDAPFTVSSNKDSIGYGETATVTVKLEASKRPKTAGEYTYHVNFMGRSEAQFPSVEIKFTLEISQITIEGTPSYEKVWGAEPDLSKIMATTKEYGQMSFAELGLQVDGLGTESEAGSYPVTNSGRFTFTNSPLPSLDLKVKKATLIPRPSITVPIYESGQKLSTWVPEVVMYNTSNNKMTVAGAFTWDRPDFGIRPIGDIISTSKHKLTFTPTSEKDQGHYEEYSRTFEVRWQGKAGAAPIITIGGTTQTYDGTPKSVTVQTNSQGRRTITYDGQTSAPRDAGTYKVVVTTEATADHAQGRAEATLTIHKAKLTVPAPTVTKEYGAPAVSLGTKSVLGKGGSYVLVQFSSPGNTQHADPGSYEIVATPATALNVQNYDVTTEGGGFSVTQATPVITDTSAGIGQEGKPLSSLPNPTFTAKNKYLDETVSGTLTWKSPETRLTAGRGSYTCVFTPDETSKVKYKSTETHVTVEATAKPVVDLKVDEASLSYTFDGSEKRVTAESATSGAKIDVTYTVNGRRQATGPTNVGEYPFEVRASVASAEYADNVVTGKLVITQATPTGYPEVSGDGGSRLSHYSLSASGFTGVGGTRLSGTISWDDPNSDVRPGVAYGWTFKPSDRNYHELKGTKLVKQGDIQVAENKEDLRKLVQEANALRGQTTVSSNGANVPPSRQWVTQEVEDTLKVHIDHAERHLADGYATQAEINHCIEPLTAAMESYRHSMKPGTMVSGGGGGGGGGAAPAPAKKQSSVVLDSRVVRMNPGDDPVEVKVSGEGNGTLIAAGSNDDVAFVERRGTSSLYVTAKRQGTSEVRVTRTATDEFEEASATLVVVVGEAPEGFDPDTMQPMPEKSNTPVYRLYNQWSTEHHYTTDPGEYERCVKDGWTGEGIVFYSDDDKAVPVYRLYNQWATVGTHHYTESAYERDVCVKNGWKLEGVGWHYMS